MEQRMDYRKASPAGLAAMSGLEANVRQSGLPRLLIELVKMRASQINGCAHCLDMHSKDARANGETEQRLYVLSAWREAPFYDECERAALEWTEALTLISENDVPEELYQRVRKQFSEKELVDLTLAIIAINGWNRLAIAFRASVGGYKPREQS